MAYPYTNTQRLWLSLRSKILIAVGGMGAIILFGGQFWSADSQENESGIEKPTVVSGDLHEAETFPIGVYDKYVEIEDDRFTDPNWQDYYTRAFQVMDENNLDSIVTPYLCDAEQLVDFVELAEANNIRVILRTNPEGCIRPGPDHPAHPAYTNPTILAYMFGDEPTSEDMPRYLRNYNYLRTTYPGTPIVSAMVGENINSDGGDIAENWQTLNTQVRMVRLYPFRQNEYDLVNWWTEGMSIPPHEILRVAEAYDRQKPWWYIIQTFGIDRPDPWWDMPSPTELTALAHTALANGARGLFAYTLQDEEPENEWLGLVTQDLQPRGDNLETLAGIARQIEEHKALLLRHTTAEFDVDTDCTVCLVVPRRDPATDQHYIYVVNKDAQSASTITILIHDISFDTAVNIYSGQVYDVQAAGNSFEITFMLQAGEGQFIHLQETDNDSYLPLISEAHPYPYPYPYP